MARTDPDPFDGDVLGDAWFADDELAELGSSGSAEEDAWVHARNRRRRARLRVIAALLVVLILFPIVITFVQRVLP